MKPTGVAGPRRTWRGGAAEGARAPGRAGWTLMARWSCRESPSDKFQADQMPVKWRLWKPRTPYSSGSPRSRKASRRGGLGHWVKCIGAQGKQGGLCESPGTIRGGPAPPALAAQRPRSSPWCVQGWGARAEQGPPDSEFWPPALELRSRDQGSERSRGAPKFRACHVSTNL